MQLALLRPIWPLFAALASGVMLAAAHAFQRFGGLQPCPLCLDQRNWHWAVVVVSLVAFMVVRFRPGFARWAGVLIGLVLLGSAGMGAYHVAVEQGWVVAQCDARVNFDNLDFNAFEGARVEVPRCDEIAWQMLGVSMAGWNGIVSLLLALASFVVAFVPERKAP